MKASEVLDKAYSNIPKEVGLNVDFEWVPLRGIKFYWFKLVRFFTR